MKAFLAAKQSSVRLGSQMFMNVSWFFILIYGLNTAKYHCHSVAVPLFTMNDNISIPVAWIS
ncbi:MAG: hypothetical protein C0397_08115 [Odoribacter sp.]|nr:hypothetical protein [Odoribacter sp.]